MLQNRVKNIEDIIFATMDTKFYTSTNWAPWLGAGFILSTIFFGLISDVWLLSFLVALSFLPALIVWLTLGGYFLVDNLELKYCYDRKSGQTTSFSIPLNDITAVKYIGKSVVIYYDKNDSYSSRIHQSAAFVAALLKFNPKIEVK
jgi:hypothetical protein